MCFRLLRVSIAIVALVFSFDTAAQNDFAGSKDHPSIPRIEGTTIFGYEYSDFDEGVFLYADEQSKLKAGKVGGRRTRILYLAPRTITRPAVFKNYQVALAELGEVKSDYSCDTKCPNDLTDGLVWKESNRIPNKIPRDAGYLYVKGNAPSFTDQGYSYVTVTTTNARYHVSLYTASFTGQWIPELKGTRSIHVEIVEEADFKPSLLVVTPDEIASEIKETGRIALYGIHFDTDSDSLKPTSMPALESIGTALKNDSSLAIYVTGHTDNQGSYEYNLDLSKRRANAVVQELISNYDISDDRLFAIGVGPVAPVANNLSEQGRALNRRVELVAR